MSRNVISSFFTPSTIREACLGRQYTFWLQRFISEFAVSLWLNVLRKLTTEAQRSREKK